MVVTQDSGAVRSASPPQLQMRCNMKNSIHFDLPSNEKINVFKCLVGFSNGAVGTCDGIAFEGKLWLVPGWNRHLTESYSKPVRIIRFDVFPYQKNGQGVFEYQNILLPIPDTALLSQLPPNIEYVDFPPNIRIDN